MSFETNFDAFYEKYITKIYNDNNYHTESKIYLQKYDKIMNEPEMKEILSNFDKLKLKYNFTCELLLDGLYGNEKYVLSESHVLGPFIVDVINQEFSFLGNKTYNTIDDIVKELYKQKIKLITNNCEDDVKFVNNRVILKCPHCNCYGKSKKSDKGLLEVNEINDDTILNNYILEMISYYECNNCNKKITSKNELLLDKLFNTIIDRKRLVIYSSNGGRYSECYTEGNIIQKK